MSENAKCPMCGKSPIKMVFGAGWAQDGYKCCGHTTETLKQWNQYAAAMELAKLEVEFENCKPKEEHQYQEMIGWARERVLGVFK